MKIGIGIDTGGTYTDALAYDFSTNAVLGCSKALTTYHDLSIGVLGALDALDPALVASAELIALSTTLATNACVEGKGGNAKLIFIDVAANTVEDVGPYYGLPRKENMLFLNSEDEDNWALGGFLDDADAFAIVALNAMKNNAIYEKKCREWVLKQVELPNVCGYELFSDINAVQRGSSAMLNARLFPIIIEFLNSIRYSLKQRNIKAPVVIMRSDATLMSEEFAGIRPVETLLCGPAASALGAMALADESESIIVDMGGTTTDVAIVQGGVPLKSGGVQVGSWRTFVKGLHIDTFGLGGDSRVFHKNNRVTLHTSRVVPLCNLASAYPCVVPKLRALVQGSRAHTLPLHEFAVLAREPDFKKSSYSQQEIKLCAALKAGPLILEDAAEALGIDAYAFNMERLVKEGVIMFSGLTPTDIMHVRGDFSSYDCEAAKLAAQYVAMCACMSLDELCDRVYDEVKRKLYCNIARILLQRYSGHYRTFGVDESALRLINEAYDMTKAPNEAHGISLFAHTPAALIGVGAPIHVFLPDVAQALGTKCVIPDYAPVANALGAIVGKISASHTTEIQPEYGVLELSSYIVYGTDANIKCKTREEALERAKEDARAAAIKEVRRRGAHGEITVKYSIDEKRASAVDTSIYLGTSVMASAVGQAK